MTTVTADPATVRETWWHRLSARRLVWAVLGVYLLARAFSAVLLAWVASQQDLSTMPGADGGTGSASYWDITHIWDGGWYRTIVEHGYPSQLPRDESGTVQQNPWAFFPAFPMLVRGLMTLTGGSYAVVAPTLSLVLGAAAAVLMIPLLRPRIGATATLCTIAVYATCPMSPVLQLAYTESLAMLLLVGFLLAVSRGEWAIGGLIALAFGFARPIAPPLGLVALVAVIWRWRARRDRPIAGTEWGAMAFLLISCAVSAVLWPAIAGLVTGEGGAYTLTQGAWRAGGSVELFTPWFNNLRYFFGAWTPLWVLAMIAVVVVSIVGPWAAALGPVLRTWIAAYSFYLLAVVDAWTSTYRYAIFLFPIAAVWIGAGWKDRDRRVLMRTRTVALVCLGLGWQVWWCWSFMHVPSLPWNPI